MWLRISVLFVVIVVGLVTILGWWWFVTLLWIGYLV